MTNSKHSVTDSDMKLKQFLEENEMSVRKFADDVGVSPMAVSRYVREQRVPRLEIAMRIAKATAYKVSLEDMMNAATNRDG